MMSRARILILSALILIAKPLCADWITPYAGGGLSIGSQEFSSSGTTSKFSSQGYLGEGGLDLAFNNKSGFMMGGEIGRTSAINGYSNSSYLEVNSLTSYGAKAGFYFGKFGFGGGYRHNEITVKSLSTGQGGYVESRYQGWTPLAFSNITFNLDNRYRTSLEFQYLTGKITSADSTQPQFNMNDISVSLRFYILFD